MALFSAQILALSPKLSNELSTEMLMLFGFLSFSNLSFESFSVKCDIQLSYWQTWYIKLVIPFFVFGILSGIFTFQRSVVFLSNRFKISILKNMKPYPIERFIYCFILLFNYIYIYLITTLMEPLNCEKAGENAYISVDVSVPCFDNSWRKQYIVGAVIFGLIYIILTPFVYGYLLWRYRSSHATPAFESRFGALTRPYKPQCFWYELVSLCRKFSVAVLPETIAFNYSRESRSLVIFTSLMFFLLMDAKFKPYRTHFLNQQSIM
jgi:hypothetical protein